MARIRGGGDASRGRFLEGGGGSVVVVVVVVIFARGSHVKSISGGAHDDWVGGGGDAI